MNVYKHIGSKSVVRNVYGLQNEKSRGKINLIYESKQSYVLKWKTVHYSYLEQFICVPYYFCVWSTGWIKNMGICWNETPWIFLDMFKFELQSHRTLLLFSNIDYNAVKYMDYIKDITDVVCTNKHIKIK